MKLDAMHPLMYRRKRRAAQQVERHQAEIGADLAARLAALDEAIDAGDGRLPAEALAPARELARRAGERLRMSGTHTVVALAGATGSGKSSLFNALAGVPVSAVGLRRPTTAAAHAVIWGAEGAGPLLDWLQVPRRHYLDFVDRPEGDHRLDGLVLLDLPDHDSTTAAHRIEVDRLVGLVDVLVWVLDPQKYADAAVHERYLRPLATHTEVMVVVLNQSDRLPAHHLDPALDDLRRLLAADGLGSVPVLATSAVSAGGLDGLRGVLADAVAAHVAGLRRVDADLEVVSAGLATAVAGPARRFPEPTAVVELTAALSAAAGVPAVTIAVHQAYRHRAARAMGSPFLRWLRRLRPDPLRRLHLGQPSDAGTVPARTAVPTTSAVQLARVDEAQRELADHASAELPEPWPAAVRAAARSRSADLADALDRAVVGADPGWAAKPAWWRVIGALQGLLAGAAIAGGLWLAGLYALAALRLPEPPLPMVRPGSLPALPLPTVLLLGGLLLGLVLALLARLLARLLAARRAARAARRLHLAVGAVADELVVAPVRTELAAYEALRTALARLRSR